MAEGIKKRVTTAVVLAAILLAVVLWLPPWGTQALLTVVVLAGAWEWSAFLRVQSIPLRIVYVALIGALMWLAWHFTADPAGRDLVLKVALVWWVVALAWVMFAPRLVSTWAAALAGVLALVPAWMALSRLVDFDRGPKWVLFALVLIWAADIGAFFVGRRFGRTRLAPNVSPGKTWEGVMGGLLASAVVAAIGSGLFGQPLQWFVPLCLAVVAFSIVGDLTESLLKRFAGLKDSGSLFPGHGGVMDRIDSVTGAAPILLFVLIKLGVHS
jgi:phosphatidate cytidylyltransferase